MPKGMYKVRFELRGNLYVEMGDFVQEIENPYEYTPDFVDVVRVGGKYYVKGFAPKIKKETKSEHSTK